ncbi:MAG TPA: cytochrome-c oxidase, cbb3-type subunit III [Gammaproteobacteria bacterium]
MNDKSNPYDAPDTGHVWDDNLRELTNPPPRWWTIAFHASWIFVVIYGILYPMVPLLNSHTKGVLGWTSIGEYKAGQAELEVIRGPYEAKLATLDAAAILADRELANYTEASAKVLFGDRCAPCHGAGGQGNPGYPVLADDDWLFGGSVDKLVESITLGRRGMMPAHAARFSAQQIDDLTTYVAGLSQGKEHAPGREIFMGAGACFACHGMDGKGNQLLGAPDLTDGIWRFAGTPEAIRHTIAHGVNDASDPQSRDAVMPSFKDALTPVEINKLAVYVHRFGGGQ